MTFYTYTWSKVAKWGVFPLYRLKALDLVTMKKLDSKVNIIPIIAKADTITKAELQKFKAKVSKMNFKFHL